MRGNKRWRDFARGGQNSYVYTEALRNRRSAKLIAYGLAHTEYMQKTLKYNLGDTRLRIEL